MTKCINNEYIDAMKKMPTIEISTDKSRLDIDYIHEFLGTSYWAKGIPKDMLQKSIDHSMCFGVYKNKRQIGFARVISDFTTFAYLADVFIDPSEQNRGFGKSLLKEILTHPDLMDLKRWHLVTKDAFGFYEKLQFSGVDQSEGHMKRYKVPKYRLG